MFILCGILSGIALERVCFLPWFSSHELYTSFVFGYMKPRLEQGSAGRTLRISVNSDTNIPFRKVTMHHILLKGSITECNHWDERKMQFTLQGVKSVRGRYFGFLKTDQILAILPVLIDFLTERRKAVHCLARGSFGYREHISVSSKLWGVCLFINRGDETVEANCGSAVKWPLYVGCQGKRRRSYHLSPSVLAKSLLRWLTAYYKREH